jgi:hypothetical protein
LFLDVAVVVPEVVFDFVEPGIMVNHEKSLDAVVTVEVDSQNCFDKVQLVFFMDVFGQIAQLCIVLDRFELIYEAGLFLVQLVYFSHDDFELLFDLGDHLLLVGRDLLGVGDFERSEHLCVAGVHES